MEWKEIKAYLATHKLSKEERIDLLNYFNQEIKAFPLEDGLVVTSNGIRLANGASLSLEQRESFMQSIKALSSNHAFRVIADQVLHMAIRKGLHEAENMDDIYYSKSAVHFIKQFKEWVEALDKLA